MAMACSGSLVRHLPGAWQQWLKSMLRVDVRARFPSAELALMELQALRSQLGRYPVHSTKALALHDRINLANLRPLAPAQDPISESPEPQSSAQELEEVETPLAAQQSNARVELSEKNELSLSSMETD